MLCDGAQDHDVSKEPPVGAFFEQRQDENGRDLNLRYFWVIEGLRVASEGPLRCNVFKEHQDPLHAAGGHIEVEIPEGVTLVSGNFLVPQNMVIEDHEAAIVLICDHASQLELSDDVIL